MALHNALLAWMKPYRTITVVSDSLAPAGPAAALEPPVVEPRVEAAARPSPRSPARAPASQSCRGAAQVLWQTRRPPPAGAGSVVNRCGGGWSAVADAPSAPARANDPHTHLEPSI